MLSLSSQQLLDAIPDAAAVVDHAGVIVAVNRAWRGFALENGGDESTEPGANYLQICRAAAVESDDAATAAADLAAVLSGASVERDLDYACATADAVHWFTTRATAIPDSGGWVLITHVDITRQKQAEEVLQDRSRRDSLTGLLHRAATVAHLENLLATSTPVAVVFLDVNDFKPINDVYGHAAGDEVLRRLAGRLTQLGSGSAADRTVAGRYGGDEFVLLRPHTDGTGLTRLLNELAEVMQRPMTVRGTELSVTVSAGGCVALGEESAADVLHRADLAMYQSKRDLRWAQTALG